MARKPTIMHKYQIKATFTFLFIAMVHTLFAQKKLEFTPPSDTTVTVQYKGKVKRGKANGQGKAELFAKGNKIGSYQGHWQDNDSHGKGTFIWVSGNKYEGDFVHGKRTGKGVHTWANGNKYEGNFVNGKGTGKGIYTWANGSRYEGDFVDGKGSGKGVKTWASGHKYEGDYVNGKRTGKGVYTWPSGNKYEGDYVDGERTGKGIYTWANGNKYEGDFLEGKRTGRGILISANGKKQEGYFVNGKLIKDGKGLGIDSVALLSPEALIAYDKKQQEIVRAKREEQRRASNLEFEKKRIAKIKAAQIGDRIRFKQRGKFIEQNPRPLENEKNEYTTYYSTNVIAYIERTEGDRMQIRIADVQSSLHNNPPIYKGVKMTEGSIHWINAISDKRWEVIADREQWKAPVFEAVEINPSPKKGMDAFRKWIADNYQYPAEAIKAKVKGTVTVSFVVERNGQLTDIKALTDIGYSTGKAAVNLLKQVDKWNPGLQGGRPVRVAYTLPIRLDATLQK
ncbi:TonB family protein [Sphingobacterium sp. SGG-5]|uniref:TonB family protein n=1 Tax=Sphingobacterium sp. SGG-5 TaxID=2710881 RepID=UPI0013EADC95|nr:TonB family protein [Sphingobacterium sp. SGG-5]NGM62896.1 TonB family protein [Sphingobacterium sp. SGG-5]